ncbi:hypothetical protein JIN84_03060 [Luteolibacter yonseiensis]|uniref:Transmembrane protein n=1 Tax=Luteolibacter yonseiensis TaxID=1144680 RepID=A0A934R154_9BACT|nr:hypothetical protein [Luteolibacter yonseiensis]MBK1814577.1 hypothetical protein [Luteolibacter yonseiensis]
MSTQDTTHPPVTKTVWFRYLRKTVAVIFLLLAAGALSGGIYLHYREKPVPKNWVTPKEWQIVPNARTLVVVVQGYRGREGGMNDVLCAVKDARKDADVILMTYSSDPFSNADCFSISKEIRDEVNRRHEEKTYEKIEFVGYSMGALLARKAYVYGCGQLQDVPPSTTTDASGKFPQEWTRNVKRFVLLAGMNRGWSLRKPPSAAGIGSLTKMWCGKWIATSTRTGSLILQTENGSPFVSNLRMQWLNVMKSPPQPAGTGSKPVDERKILRPTVVQLLGDTDDLVDKDDSRDVNVSGKRFVWVQLNQTNHQNIVDLGDKCTPVSRLDAEGKIKRARRDLFLRSFGDDDEIRVLKRMSPGVPEAEDYDVTEGVIVLHGIRDLGQWTSDFVTPLQEKFIAKKEKEKADDKKQRIVLEETLRTLDERLRQDSDPALLKEKEEAEADLAILKRKVRTPKLLVYRPSYGYFPMGSFLVWQERQKNVRWFMDELTELMAKYPNMETIHFVGHSNGTYVLASALTKYKALKVDKVIFAGSVVRQDYFANVGSSLEGRVGGIRNYVGSSDWVVGIFPHFFESGLTSWINPDIGAAGYYGFEKPAEMPEENWKKFMLQTKFVTGQHSAALDDYAAKQSMIHYLMEEDRENLEGQSRSCRELFLEKCVNHCWMIWAGIIALLTLIGYILVKSALFLNKWLAGGRWRRSRVRCVTLACYGLLILALLQTY